MKWHTVAGTGRLFSFSTTYVHNGYTIVGASVENRILALSNRSKQSLSTSPPTI